jgi:hypothetical protein
MTSVYEINWDDNFLPLYGTTITIPANTIVWRGFDPQFPAISDRPAYYGSQRFAQGYAEKYNTDAKPFITTRPLHLLDIRYMKILLSQLFEHNHTSHADDVILCATSISFGLCSLQHQIKLFKYRYKKIYETDDPSANALKTGINNLEALVDPAVIYEKPGVRIAETANDSIVMGFLKELFSKHYDGYISPNIMTPFHIEKKNFILNSELVLFNPIMSGIKLLKAIPSTKLQITINWCILQSGQSYRTIDTRGMKTSYYGANITKKGGSINEVSVDYNNLIDKGDKSIIKLYNEGLKLGKKWSNKPIKLYSADAPGPTVNMSIFKDGIDINTFRNYDLTKSE